MKTDFYPRIAGILWVISFLSGFAYFPDSDWERLGCVLTGFAGLGILVASGGALRDRAVAAPFLSLLVALFALLAGVSAIWSVAPAYSILFLAGFLLLPATILAVLVAAPQNRLVFLRWAGTGAGLAVVLTALVALGQMIFLPGILVNGQPRYPIANPNALAGLFSLGFFAGFGFYMQDGSRNRRFLYAGGLLVILTAFLAIGGKAASLGLVVGLLALILLGDRQALKARWKSLTLLGGGGVVLSLAVNFLAHQRGAFDRVYGMMIGGETATIANRIDIWQAAFKLVAEHPLLGSGYASFPQLYPAVRMIGDYYSSGLRVHLDPLQFWVELGVMGPVLFYAIGGVVMLQFLRFRKRERAQNAAPDMLALSLFLGCGAFLAHSHVDFLFYVTPPAMAFGLAVTMLVLRLQDGAADRRVFSGLKNIPPVLQGPVVMLPFLVFVAVYLPVWGGEYYANRAARALQAGDLNDFAASVNNANRIGLGLNARPYLMAAMVPMDILAAAPYTRLDQQQALFHQIDGLLEQALRRNRALASVWYQRGMMLSHLSPDIVPADYVSGEDAFKTALDLDPQHLPARLALADDYAARGREQAEYEILLDGVARPYPTYDAAPYYDRLRALALRDPVRAGDLAVIDQYAEIHSQRVAAARRYESAVKAALGGVKSEFFLIP